MQKVAKTRTRFSIPVRTTHCNCWAHLRRRFHEAIAVDSEDSVAKTGRDFCDKLFAIEAELDSLTTEERFIKRLMQEKPVFEAFWSWAEKISQTVPKLCLERRLNMLSSAVNILAIVFKTETVLSQIMQLKMLSDLSQSAEKNWLFSDTTKGAKASADVYSIVETAKANGLDVFKYFELILTVLPSMEFLTNPDILEELLPWNKSVQKICKVI